MTPDPARAVRSAEPVPFLDLVRLHRSIADELRVAFEGVLATGRFVGPASSAGFEAAFASAHGLTGTVGCGSGTDALTLALVALGVGPGDEVIVPAMTFVATAEAVIHTGATPVLADVDPKTLLLGREGVDAVRTARTRAVVPVHLYGHVVPFDLLEEWRADGLMVVEDAAQAHLATWRGRPVGSVGHAACFSFYPGKNLGALGDGGAVGSNEPSVLAAAASLRDHGSTTRNHHDRVGWCSRLDGVQAAWLEVKLGHLRAWTDRRSDLARRYRDRLRGGVVVDWEEGAVHHLLVVRVHGDARDDLATALGAAGIGTGVHYPLALSEQLALAPWSRPCPVAEQAAAEVLSLPLDPLMDDADVDRVADTVTRLLA